MIDKTLIANKFKQVLKSLKLSKKIEGYEDLASKFKTPEGQQRKKAYISEMANGRSSPSKEIVDYLEKTFRINPGFIFDGDPNMYKQSTNKSTNYEENTGTSYLSEGEIQVIKEHMNEVQQNNSETAKENLSETSINKLINANELLAKSHIIFAESHRMFSETHKKLVDSNERLSGMLEKSTAGVERQIPQDVYAMLASLQEVVTVIGTGKRFESRNEVAALLYKSDPGAQGNTSSSDIQRDSGSQNMIRG